MNNLHGGSRGFDQRVWSAQIRNGYLPDLVTLQALKEGLPQEQVTGVVFTRVSADGEEGFPVELKIEAGYFITAVSELVFTWAAWPKGENKFNTPTPINLTNHAYWNLSGNFTQPTVA